MATEKVFISVEVETGKEGCVITSLTRHLKKVNLVKTHTVKLLQKTM